MLRERVRDLRPPPVDLGSRPAPQQRGALGAAQGPDLVAGRDIVRDVLRVQAPDLAPARRRELAAVVAAALLVAPPLRVPLLCIYTYTYMYVNL